MSNTADFGTFQNNEDSFDGLVQAKERSAMADESAQKYPTPLSFNWRVVHWICYMNGGITFFLGSVMLYPSINYAVTSSQLYTLGSATFLIADTLEWLTNNHVGCFWYEPFKDSYEATVKETFEPRDTQAGRWQRAEVGLNFFLSTMGSFFYLVGSALFLPDVNQPTKGLYFFILASAIIVSAQVWKVYRGGLGPARNSAPGDSITSALRARFDDERWNIRRINWVFDRNNYEADIPGFWVDFLVIIGASGYLFGSIPFLPQYDTSDGITNFAVTLFVIGGIFFTMSGFSMFYRYFFTQNYPH